MSHSWETPCINGESQNGNLEFLTGAISALIVAFACMMLLGFVKNGKFL
jgi:hypothetical protein